MTHDTMQAKRLTLGRKFCDYNRNCKQNMQTLKVPGCAARNLNILCKFLFFPANLFRKNLLQDGRPISINQILMCQYFVKCMCTSYKYIFVHLLLSSFLVLSLLLLLLLYSMCITHIHRYRYITCINIYIIYIYINLLMILHRPRQAKGSTSNAKSKSDLWQNWLLHEPGTVAEEQGSHAGRSHIQYRQCRTEKTNVQRTNPELNRAQYDQP